MRYGPKTVTNGLIFALDAGDKNSYPGSGNTWYDLSGNKYHATLFNTPTFRSSVGNGTFEFNGSTQFASVALPSTLTVSTFSYNIWVKTFGKASAWATIFDQGNDDWLLATFNNIVNIYDPNFDTGVTLNTSIWYNISVTHTFGSPIYVYINGSLSYTSTNDSTSKNTSYFSIGAGYVGVTANEFWNGQIAIVNVYNRELTSAEVLQNYTINKSRFYL